MNTLHLFCRPRCQSQIKLYKRSIIPFYSLLLVQLTLVTACPRNRISSSVRTARNQHCQDRHNGQAKRHPDAGAHVHRSQATSKGHKGLSGRREDVRLGLKSVELACTNSMCFRFVFSPTSDVEKRLSSETAELKSDVSNLNKKLHYLETTHKNSREHIEKMIQSGGR